MPALLLRFALAEGQAATLLLAEASTVLSVGDTVVSSWDLCGRPYALVRDSGTYRRGLDGGLLRKREASAAGPRLRCRLTAAEGATVIEAARLEAESALRALTGSTHAPSASGQTPNRCEDTPNAAGNVGDTPNTSDNGSHAPFANARGAWSRAAARLRAIVAMDTNALATDAVRFLEASGRVGILPPDQYLSLVVRVTEGCSWNACTFCGLYRDVPFRFRTRPQLERHIDALRAYFGRSIALRRSVFLGDANALCLGQDRLLPLLEAVARAFPGAPLASFVDAWSGQRKTPDDWRACAALGLRRVYVGLESGDPGLLSWLEKPGSPADAVALVRALHAAGVGAGVIVLVGAGGERFARSHVQRTAEVLDAMQLGREDLLNFSEYVDDPSLRYAAKAASAPQLAPLSSERSADQRAAIVAALRHGASNAVRSATYDIREFVY